ncbi:MerR family transcriptional regulator [Streptomyces sp. NPDC046977]|uniref:MerR family transcriptional regulator n=1 Tax=Streptomyces sp. NPDC046977 TaxID=3154703 RepID=UPI0033ED0C18
MRIGELSRRTGVPVRLLRYYEEQRLLAADRDARGHRDYAASAVLRVHQIRGLLDSGLRTSLIEQVLPQLDGSPDRQMRPTDVPAELADVLRDERDRLQQRIDELTRHRDALDAFVTAIPPERTTR